MQSRIPDKNTRQQNNFLLLTFFGICLRLNIIVITGLVFLLEWNYSLVLFQREYFHSWNFPYEINVWPTNEVKKTKKNKTKQQQQNNLRMKQHSVEPLELSNVSKLRHNTKFITQCIKIYFFPLFSCQCWKKSFIFNLFT